MALDNREILQRSSCDEEEKEKQGEQQQEQEEMPAWRRRRKEWRDWSKRPRVQVYCSAIGADPEARSQTTVSSGQFPVITDNCFIIGFSCFKLDNCYQSLLYDSF